MITDNQTSNFYADLGQLIKMERLDRGISQEKLAEGLKINRSSLANIELGKQKAPLHLVINIALLLEIKFNQLLPNYSRFNSGQDPFDNLQVKALNLNSGGLDSLRSFWINNK